MNWEYFISQKISKDGGKRNFSAPIVRISVIAIALGLAVMILTMGIVSGFKTEIRNTIAQFNGHLIASALKTGESYEEAPVDMRELDTLSFQAIPTIKSIELSARMGGIIKTSEGVKGVLFKGVQSNYQHDFLSNELISGRLPHFSDTVTSAEILISSSIARQLKLDTGMTLIAYFIQEQSRIRKFTITGIFNSNLDGIDQLIYCDLRQIQRLKNWEPYQIGAIEIFLHEFKDIELALPEVNDVLGYRFMPDGSRLVVEPVTRKYALLFSWLSLFDTNTMVIISLMILVALINMSSGLLILILEKTGFIALLKSMGAPNNRIRRIFLYQAGQFIIRGLFFGNLIGIGLAILQQTTGLISLNPETYYVATMPIKLEIMDILLLNLGTGILILLFMILPTSYVSRIEPDKALKIG